MERVAFKPPARSRCVLVEEVLVILGGEVILGAGLAAQGSAIGNLLEVVEAAGDTAVPVHVVGVQVDARPALHTAVHLGAVEDGLTIRIHNTRLGAAVGVDEIAALVGFVIGALQVAIAERGLDGGQGRDSLAAALQLGLAFLVGSLDRRLDLLYGLGVGLGDDEGYRELRRTAVDCLGIPAVQIAECADAGHHLGEIHELWHNNTLLYSLKSVCAVFFNAGRLSDFETKVGLPGGL